MVAFGLGEMCGSQFLGWCVDKLGARRASLVNIALMVSMGAFMLTFLLINRFTWLAFVMAFFFGLQDSSVNIQCLEILGFEFSERDGADPFAAFYCLQSLACFAIQLGQSVIITHEAYIWYTGLASLYGLAALTYLYVGFPFRTR